MKIWVMTVSDGEDVRFYGAYSTEELVSGAAEKYLDAHPDESCSYWEATVEGSQD